MKIVKLIVASILVSAVSVATAADPATGVNLSNKEGAVPANSMPMMPSPPACMQMKGGCPYGGMPMMQGPQGRMPMMHMMRQKRAMMQQRQAMKQAHMNRMEMHLANIEALLKQLVELQKK